MYTFKVRKIVKKLCYNRNSTSKWNYLQRYSMRELRVFYGWAKINGIRKREAISVIFENELDGDPDRKMKFINRMQDTVFVRAQTDQESKDSEGVSRAFTEFSIYMDDKNIKGSLSAALEFNFQADKNHISEEIREEIRSKLHDAYLKSHRGYKEPERKIHKVNPVQLEIFI